MALWSEITGYEGLYLVSNEGDVVALPKTVISAYRTSHREAKPLRKFLRGKNGHYYEAVALSKNGVLTRCSVHRLVAQAFLPNPENLPEINHKDENPLNNRVENLEWCTRKYNAEYSKSKPVFQIDSDGNSFLHKSINAASESTGINRRSISNVLNGWAMTAGGYKWEYARVK